MQSGALLHRGAFSLVPAAQMKSTQAVSTFCGHSVHHVTSLNPWSTCQASLLRSAQPSRSSHLGQPGLLYGSLPRLRNSLSQRGQHSSLLCRARSGRDTFVEQPTETEMVFPKGQSLESTKLPSALRERVEDAVQSLGGRATVGDVAARAGTKLEEAEEALNALAADSLGTLQVSEEGDVLYVLPSNFKAIISGRSWLLRVQPFLKSIKAGAEYLVRVSFGTTLIASVVMVWAAIIAIMSSSSDRDDNRRRNNYGGGGYGYGNGYSRGSGMYFNLTDLLWYWDPYYYRSRRMRMSSGEEMGFLESVFSFVFGDGDPNLTYDEQRWKLVGRFIQHRGGVVTAEELAPYLDVPKTFGDPDSDTVDEAFVVPALVRFGGSPEVDSDGNLLYRFPSLQRTARAQAVPPPGERAALESTWKFSSASAGQRFAAAALGAANLVGVVVLGSLLRDPQMQYRLAHSGLAFVGGLFPLLQVYAGAFFAIPAIRWILNQQKNLAIQARNDARLRQFERLQQPDLKLRAKLLNAARSSQRTVIRDSDIVYRSDKALESQPQDLDGLDFDRRLRELESM